MEPTEGCVHDVHVYVYDLPEPSPAALGPVSHSPSSLSPYPRPMIAQTSGGNGDCSWTLLTPAYTTHSHHSHRSPVTVHAAPLLLEQ